MREKSIVEMMKNEKMAETKIREKDKRSDGNIYAEPYDDLLQGCGPIDPGVAFGADVRIGHQSVIRAGCRVGSRTRISHFVCIDENIKIGENVFIGDHVKIRSGVSIGDNSIIGHNVVIETNTKIGNHTTVQSGTHITGDADIGDRVFFGPNVCTTNTKKICHGRNFTPIIKGPTIKRGARIGGGSTILPGVVIGENATIGAGAVVTKSVPDGEVWVGNPAQCKSTVPPNEWL